MANKNLEYYYLGIGLGWAMGFSGITGAEMDRLTEGAIDNFFPGSTQEGRDAALKAAENRLDGVVQAAL